jgi:hypothetical protein
MRMSSAGASAAISSGSGAGASTPGCASRNRRSIRAVVSIRVAGVEPVIGRVGGDLRPRHGRQVRHVGRLKAHLLQLDRRRREHQAVGNRLRLLALGDAVHGKALMRRLRAAGIGGRLPHRAFERLDHRHA